MIKNKFENPKYWTIYTPATTANPDPIELINSIKPKWDPRLFLLLDSLYNAKKGGRFMPKAIPLISCKKRIWYTLETKM